MVVCPECGAGLDLRSAELRGDLARCPHCGGWVDVPSATVKQGDEILCPCGARFYTGWRRVRNGRVECPKCGGWIDVDVHLVKPRPKRIECPCCETLVGPDSAVMQGEGGKKMVLCAGCGGWFAP